MVSEFSKLPLSDLQCDWSGTTPIFKISVLPYSRFLSLLNASWLKWCSFPHRHNGSIPVLKTLLHFWARFFPRPLGLGSRLTHTMSHMQPRLTSRHFRRISAITTSSKNTPTTTHTTAATGNTGITAGWGDVREVVCRWCSWWGKRKDVNLYVRYWGRDPVSMQ